MVSQINWYFWSNQHRIYVVWYFKKLDRYWDTFLKLDWLRQYHHLQDTKVLLWIQVLLRLVQWVYFVNIYLQYFPKSTSIKSYFNKFSIINRYSKDTNINNFKHTWIVTWSLILLKREILSSFSVVFNCQSVLIVFFINLCDPFLDFSNIWNSVVLYM